MSSVRIFILLLAAIQLRFHVRSEIMSLSFFFFLAFINTMKFMNILNIRSVGLGNYRRGFTEREFIALAIFQLREIIRDAPFKT